MDFGELGNRLGEVEYRREVMAKQEEKNKEERIGGIDIELSRAESRAGCWRHLQLRLVYS